MRRSCPSSKKPHAAGREEVDDLIALGERLGDGEDFAAIIAAGNLGLTKGRSFQVKGWPFRVLTILEGIESKSNDRVPPAF